MLVKKYFILVLGVLLLLFLAACGSEKEEVEEDVFDVTGYYIGHLTVSKLETVTGEEGWEGHSTDVEFSIIREGQMLTLTHMPVENDEDVLEGATVAGVQTLDLDEGEVNIEESDSSDENPVEDSSIEDDGVTLKTIDSDSILNYGESYTGIFDDETGMFEYNLEEYGIIKLEFEEVENNISVTGFFEFDNKEEGLKDRIDIILERVEV